MKSSTKKAPATSAPVRAKTLKPKDRVAAKLSAEERALEKKRRAKRAASKRWYEKNKLKQQPSLPPVVATASAPASASASASASAAGITKQQLVAALEVHVAAARVGQHRERVEALETALGLARLLG